MKKVLLPGIIGSLVVFLCSFVTHMFTPIGSMGLKNLPNNEDAVLGSLKSNIQEPGLYFMPGIDMSRTPTEAETTAYSAKYEAGPTAFLVYHPTGEKPMSPGQLLRQLLFTALGGLIVAYILSLTAASLTARAIISALIALFAWLSFGLPQWNWYRFPMQFTLGEGIDRVLCWLIGGFVIAWLIQRAEKRAAV